MSNIFSNNSTSVPNPFSSSTAKVRTESAYDDDALESAKKEAQQALKLARKGYPEFSKESSKLVAETAYQLVKLDPNEFRTHPTPRPFPHHPNNSFNLKGLLAIADLNHDSNLSSDELSKASPIVDIDCDSKLSELEIDLVSYIARKDKKNGFSTREREALNNIKHLIDNYNIKLTPDTVHQLKYRVDHIIKNTQDTPKAIDLNKNHKIDHFELIAAKNFGVNSKNTTIEQMVNIADSNCDGKVGEHEFNKIKNNLDLNSDHKVVKSEFELNEHIAQLNKQDGFQYPEEIIASVLKQFLLNEKNATGKPFDINSHNLQAFKGGATGMYDMLINIGDTAPVEHQKLWKGTVPAPEIRGQGYRNVPREEFDAVIDQKIPLEHVDMNYSFATGPDDYTKRMLTVIYERISEGKMTEAEGKQRYVDIITKFRNSNDQYAQHEVTPWRS